MKSKIFVKVNNLHLVYSLLFLLIGTTFLPAQIITLTELDKNYKITDYVSLKTSGSYKVIKNQNLNTAIEATVTNNLATSIDNVDVTILLCKSLPSLKDYIENMGTKESDSADDHQWTYIETDVPGIRDEQEQIVSFTAPFRTKQNENRHKRVARAEGTYVETLYHGPLSLPGSETIKVIEGKNITLNKDIKPGIYRVAVVLSHMDASKINMKAKINVIHYLIVKDAPATN